MKKIFIDGSAGTTGLRIHDRLMNREGIELITLSDELRKDSNARREAMNGADIVFLCLPDAAAIEAVSMIENPNTAVIDTSTAHRTADGWVYGFAELDRREAIAGAKRIANPGCHASGFVALVYPLVQAGLLSRNAALSCFSLTGYSGGGKKMIAEYESITRDERLSAPRQYALAQAHKHLPEMSAITGLTDAPAFCPIVGDFYSGMEVTVPLFARDLYGSVEEIRAIYRERYNTALVHYEEESDEGGFLSASTFSGRDDMEIRVEGNDERILLIARFDNLGKGASGAAIQNMNILLGVEETTGLCIQ